MRPSVASRAAHAFIQAEVEGAPAPGANTNRGRALTRFPSSTRVSLPLAFRGELVEVLRALFPGDGVAHSHDLVERHGEAGVVERFRGALRRREGNPRVRVPVEGVDGHDRGRLARGQPRGADPTADGE